MNIRPAINASLTLRANDLAQCRELGRKAKAARREPEVDRTERLLAELFPQEDWDRRYGVIERRGNG